MRPYLAFIAAVCAACAGSEPTEQCRAWGSCLPGNLVVRFEILDDVFPPRHDRAGAPAWGPGDTIAFRVAVENQTTAPAESFTFEAGFGPAGEHTGEARPIQLEPMTVPRLEPGQRVLFTDTAVVALEIHEPLLRLEVSGSGTPTRPRSSRSGSRGAGATSTGARAGTGKRRLRPRWFRRASPARSRSR